MNVLCVVAHPDDEVLMCGGTIARHAAAGDYVHVLVIADGVSSRLGSQPKEFQERLAACSKASDILGSNGEVLGWPDQKLDTMPQLEINRAIEKRIQDHRPEIVYTHWHGDLNLDHYLVSAACKVACRPGSGVRELLMGEVPSSSDLAGGFNPNVFIEIKFDPKLEALQCYDPEMRKMPHPRAYPNVLALANYRGAQAGVMCAEAFEAVRIVR